MNQRQSAPSKKGFYAGLGGTIVVAVCCFTPLLVITLGIVGLSAFTPYLDYVLFPALAVLVVLTVVSYTRWRRSTHSHKRQDEAMS
ncbi:MAG: mercury resistance system transport protein MerF [Deltaproteobacteria bacterium]|nr:mercury resistance system transport protein MerF [Deltaproteobacteria bacterium]